MVDCIKKNLFHLSSHNALNVITKMDFIQHLNRVNMKRQRLFLYARPVTHDLRQVGLLIKTIKREKENGETSKN